MRSKPRVQPPLLRDHWPTSATRIAAPAPAPQASPFVAELIGCAESQTSESPGQQLVRQLQPTYALRPGAFGQGLMTRAWSWLHKTYAHSAKKQLRVTETISLGEKRFVAIIHADGCKFLIGGGASGVSLLKQLGSAPESAGSLQSVMGLTEYSE